MRSTTSSWHSDAVAGAVHPIRPGLNATASARPHRNGPLTTDTTPPCRRTTVGQSRIEISRRKIGQATPTGTKKTRAAVPVGLRFIPPLPSGDRGSAPRLGEGDAPRQERAASQLVVSLTSLRPLAKRGPSYQPATASALPPPGIARRVDQMICPVLSQSVADPARPARRATNRVSASAIASAFVVASSCSVATDKPLAHRR